MSDREFIAAITRLLETHKRQIRKLEEFASGKRIPKLVKVRAYSVKAYKVKAHIRWI